MPMKVPRYNRQSEKKAITLSPRKIPTPPAEGFSAGNLSDVLGPALNVGKEHYTDKLNVRLAAEKKQRDKEAAALEKALKKQKEIEKGEKSESAYVQYQNRIRESLHSDEDIEVDDGEGGKTTIKKGHYNRFLGDSAGSTSEWSAQEVEAYNEAMDVFPDDAEQRLKLEKRLNSERASKFEAVLKYEKVQKNKNNTAIYNNSKSKGINDARIAQDPMELFVRLNALGDTIDNRAKERGWDKVITSEEKRAVFEAAIENAMKGSLVLKQDGSNGRAMLDFAIDRGFLIEGAEGTKKLESEFDKTTEAHKKEVERFKTIQQNENIDAILKDLSKSGNKPDSGLTAISAPNFIAMDKAGEIQTGMGPILADWAEAITTGRDDGGQTIGEKIDDGTLDYVSEEEIRIMESLWRATTPEKVGKMYRDIMSDTKYKNTPKGRELGHVLLELTSRYAKDQYRQEQMLAGDAFGNLQNLMKKVGLENNTEALYDYMGSLGSMSPEEAKDAAWGKEVLRQEASKEKENIFGSTLGDFSDLPGIETFEKANEGILTYFMKTGITEAEASAKLAEIKEEVTDAFNPAQIVNDYYKAIDKAAPMIRKESPTANRVMNEAQEEANANEEIDSLFDQVINEASGFINKSLEHVKRGTTAFKLDVLTSQASMSNKIDYARDVKPLVDKFRKESSDAPLRGTNIVSDTMFKIFGMAPGIAIGQLHAAKVGMSSSIVTKLAGGDPISTALAGKAGHMYGGLSIWQQQGAGEVYYDLNEAEVPDNIAIPVSQLTGLIYAGVEYSQAGRIFGINGTAAKRVASELLRKVIKRFILHRGTDALVNVGEEVVQKWVTSTATEVTKRAFGVSENAKSNIFKYVMLQGVNEAKEAALPMFVLTALGLPTATSAIQIYKDEKSIREIRKNTSEQVAKIARLQEMLDSGEVGIRNVPYIGPVSSDAELGVEFNPEMKFIDADIKSVEKGIKPYGASLTERLQEIHDRKEMTDHFKDVALDRENKQVTDEIESDLSLFGEGTVKAKTEKVDVSSADIKKAKEEGTVTPSKEPVRSQNMTDISHLAQYIPAEYVVRMDEAERRRVLEMGVYEFRDYLQSEEYKDLPIQTMSTSDGKPIPDAVNGESFTLEQLGDKSETKETKLPPVGEKDPQTKQKLIASYNKARETYNDLLNKRKNGVFVPVPEMEKAIQKLQRAKDRIKEFGTEGEGGGEGAKLEPTEPTVPEGQGVVPLSPAEQKEADRRKKISDQKKVPKDQQAFSDDQIKKFEAMKDMSFYWKAGGDLAPGNQDNGRQIRLPSSFPTQLSDIGLTHRHLATVFNKVLKNNQKLTVKQLETAKILEDWFDEYGPAMEEINEITSEVQESEASEVIRAADKAEPSDQQAIEALGQVEWGEILGEEETTSEDEGTFPEVSERRLDGDEEQSQATTGETPQAEEVGLRQESKVGDNIVESEERDKALEDLKFIPVDSIHWADRLGVPRITTDVWQQFYQKTFNRMQGIENITQLAKELGAVIPDGVDAGAAADRYLSVAAQAKRLLSTGTFEIDDNGRSRVTGEGFEPILKDYYEAVKHLIPNQDEAYKDLERFLIATRTIEDLQRPRSIFDSKLIVEQKDVDLAKELLNKLSLKYGDNSHFKPFARRIYDFQAKVLHMLVDSGALSQKQFDYIQKVNPNYISFERMMPDDSTYFIGSPSLKKGFDRIKAPVNKIKGGSDLEIANVFESVIKNTFKIMDAAGKGQVYKDLYALKDVEGLGVIERQPDLRPVAKVKHRAAIDKGFLDQVIAFGKTIGIKVRTGKQIQKNKAGFYLSKTKEAVRAFATPSQAIAHELGHGIDDKYKLSEQFYALANNKDKKGIKDELLDLMDRMNETAERKGDKTERFADGFEWWLVHRDIAQREMPKFSFAMEQIIRENPDLRPLIDVTPTPHMSIETQTETIFRPSAIKPSPKFDGVVIEGKIDGETTFLEVPKQLATSMDSLTDAEKGWLVQAISHPANWLKAGATITPEFMTKNLIRDQFAAYIQTNVGFIPLVDSLAAIPDILNQTEDYNNWIRSGGSYGGFVELSREQLKPLLDSITKNPKIVSWNKLNPFFYANKLQDISQVLEQATRLGIYKAAKKKGMSDVAAARESREGTVNFGRRGSSSGVQKFNSVKAFFGAGLAAADKNLRTLNPFDKTRTPAQKKAGYAKAFVSITLPSIALSLINGKDPYYDEIPRWMRDMFWMVRIGESEKGNPAILGLTHARTSDGGVWVRVPKPYFYGFLFGSVVERLMEYQRTGDAEIAFEGLGAGVIDAISPIAGTTTGGFLGAISPTAVTPIIENVANYSFFRNRPLVSLYLDKMLSPDQYNRYTTDTAKTIGAALGGSPAKVENIIKGYWGGTGKHVLDGGDLIMRIMDGETSPRRPMEASDVIGLKAFVARKPAGATSASVTRFYKQRLSIEEARNSYQKHKKDGDHEGAAKIKEDHPDLVLFEYVNSAADKISDYRKKIDKVNSSKTMTDNEKRAALKGYDKIILDTAKKANKKIKENKEKAKRRKK